MRPCDQSNHSRRPSPIIPSAAPDIGIRQEKGPGADLSGSENGGNERSLGKADYRWDGLYRVNGGFRERH